MLYLVLSIIYPYTHTNEKHKGFAYFGLGGSESEMKSAPGPGLIRPKGHNVIQVNIYLYYGDWIIKNFFHWINSFMPFSASSSLHEVGGQKWLNVKP